MQERFRSTEQLASERLRHLTSAAEDERTGRDPDELAAEAEQVRAQETALREALHADQARLAEAVSRRQELERQLAAAERALVEAVKAIADRREGLAKLTGQVDAARSRGAAADEEIERHETATTEARERAEVAEEAYEVVAAQAAGLDDEDADLVARHTSASQAYERAQARAKELGDAERTAEREASEWGAREEALALGLRRKDGAGALLAAGDRVPGLLGSVAALLAVDPGMRPRWPPRWARSRTPSRCPLWTM